MKLNKLEVFWTVLYLLGGFMYWFDSIMSIIMNDVTPISFVFTLFAFGLTVTGIFNFSNLIDEEVQE